MKATSLPSPPLSRSLPSLPRNESLPRPPFIVSCMPSASSELASMTSSPPRALSVRRSLACSWKAMLTAVCSPKTLIPPASPAAPKVSAPWVPLTVIVSAAPSPPPLGPRRSTPASVRSVPERSPTTTLSAPPSARKSMFSTSSRSIVTLAMLRKNRTRPPLAEMSMFSATLAPKNSIESLPSWPSSVSLPSPGSHWNTSAPAPMKATSSPLSPKLKSSPSPPRSTSAHWEPSSVSPPAPPSIVSLMTPAGSVVALTASLPPSVFTTRLSWVPSELVMFTWVGSPITVAEVPAPRTSTTSSPPVPLMMTVSAATSPAVPFKVPARSPSRRVTSVPDKSLTVIVSVLPKALRSTTSTSLVSITMLPRSRVKRSRSPLAEASKRSAPALPLNSIVSVPAWPSTVSLPSPGSHWNVSSPAPRKATSLPCWPSTKSLPSPPLSTSMPLLPRRVSSPAPPSTLSLISAARFPVAEKRSLPPLALSTRFSEVPMSMAKGAGSRRSNLTRVPLAVAVNASAPLPPLTSTVSLPAPPSLRSVSSPGFQIIRSLPLSPNTWSSASPPVRVSFSVPPNRKSTPPWPRSVSLPACPNSMSPPAPPVRTSLPAPPNRLALGSAPLVWLRVIVSFPPRPNTWISAVLATVGVPPETETAPPLTSSVPAALRLMTIVLAALSPDTLSVPLLNVAVVAALADWLAATAIPAPITPPTSSRRTARSPARLLLRFTISPLL